MAAGRIRAARFSRSIASSTGSLASDSSISTEPAVTGLTPILNQRPSAVASTHQPSGVSRTVPSAKLFLLVAEASVAGRLVDFDPMCPRLNAQPLAFFASRSIFIGRSSVVRKSPKTTQVPSGVWIGAHAVAEAQLADVDVEQELLVGIAPSSAVPTGTRRPCGNGAAPGQRQQRQGAAQPAGAAAAS